jgi:hypothetical protein
MKKPNQQNDLNDQEVQLPYLLFKVKSLLEVAKQYFCTREHNSESRRKIDKALNSINALPHEFDGN